MPEITTVDDLTGAPHAEVFEEPQPRAVRLRLDADEQVPPHSHPGTDVVLYLVSGSLELSLDDEDHELRAGQIARFSGEREISPRAREASTALVVFAPAENRSD
jgi:quercetin dioxygenase-like cupin family protein